MQRTKEVIEGRFGLPDIGIPAEVLLNPNLTMREKVLFGFIRNLAQTEKGCWASNRFLGKLIGAGPQTVTNAVARLREQRYLIVEHEVRSSDGKQVRRIFIDPEYAVTYREMVVEWNKTILENLYTPINSVIDPQKKSASKQVIEDVREYTSSSSISRWDPNLPVSKDQFEAFWSMYPRKVDKGKAKSRWGKLCWRNDRPSWKEVKGALIKQKKSERWQDSRFIPHPATWINQQRWLDDPSMMVSYARHGEQQPVELPERLRPALGEALGLLPASDNGDEAELARNILDLAEWYEGRQQRPNDLRRMASSDEECERAAYVRWAEIIPSSARLIEMYVDWLSQQSWLDAPAPGVFTPSSKVFQRFLRQAQREAGQDFFTGRDL